MNRQALNTVLDYIEDQRVSVQITYENGYYTVDFRSRIHAETCHAELKDAGFYDTTTLLTGYHMRVR